MKKITTISAFFILYLSVCAQIPNSSFETWNNMGAYLNPDQWGTMNNTTAVGSVFTATQGTPGNPGSYFLKLTSKTVGAAVVNGIAVSGILDSTTMQPRSGFAFSQQPASFTGSWQHMISGNSQGSISITLTKWNSGTHVREVVATANQTLSGMAMSWASFSIPFSYVSVNIPDSCIIFLKASGASPVNGDYLWVDKLSFVGTAAGVETHPSIFSDLAVFPNPSSENISVDFTLSKVQKVKIQMIDLNGKLIKEADLGSINGTSKYSLNINGIAKGSYFIHVIAEDGTETKKIVIN